jgi:hypothetical protein
MMRCYRGPVQTSAPKRPALEDATHDAMLLRGPVQTSALKRLALEDATHDAKLLRGPVQTSAPKRPAVEVRGTIHSSPPSLVRGEGPHMHF